MKVMIIPRGANSLVVLGAIVCLLMVNACGNGDKVDNKGPEAKVANGDQGSAIAASTATPVTSMEANTGDAVQAGATKVLSSDSPRASINPKPQIGTGGSDFFLFTQARGVLGADSELKAANIIIDVKAGVLTLSGTVVNATQKSKAEELMRGVGGVKEVKNRLRISN